MMCARVCAFPVAMALFFSAPTERCSDLQHPEKPWYYGMCVEPSNAAS